MSRVDLLLLLHLLLLILWMLLWMMTLVLTNQICRVSSMCAVVMVSCTHMLYMRLGPLLLGASILLLLLHLLLLLVVVALRVRASLVLLKKMILIPVHFTELC